MVVRYQLMRQNGILRDAVNLKTIFYFPNKSLIKRENSNLE